MVLLAVNMPVFASETLFKGSVLYTVESARKLAFEGLALKLDKEKIKPYLIDENNEENMGGGEQPGHLFGQQRQQRGFAAAFDPLAPDYRDGHGQMPRVGPVAGAGDYDPSGPGGSCKDSHGNYFNLKKQRVIMFDLAEFGLA